MSSVQCVYWRQFSVFASVQCAQCIFVCVFGWSADCTSTTPRLKHVCRSNNTPTYHADKQPTTSSNTQQTLDDLFGPDPSGSGDTVVNLEGMASIKGNACAIKWGAGAPAAAAAAAVKAA